MPEDLVVVLDCVVEFKSKSKRRLKRQVASAK